MYKLKGVCWCVDGDVESQFGLGASSEQPGKEVYMGGLAVEETMYGALPQLQNLRYTQEQIDEDEGGFKVIIWG